MLLCCVLMCGSPKLNLLEHTLGLLNYFPSPLGDAPKTQVGTLKA